MPVFRPLRCAECQSIIRGILFRCVKEECKFERPLKPGDYICEDCYREPRHPQSHMAKEYKHSVLRSSITEDISRRICRCTSVRQRDANGQSIPLFPVAATAQHRIAGGAKCGLLNLKDRISDAKLEQQHLKVATRKHQDEKRKASARVDTGSPIQPTKGPKNFSHVKGRPGTGAQQAASVEKNAHKDIPWYLRKNIKKIPFGNVHIMLMVGTIIIENGVPGQVAMHFLYTGMSPLTEDQNQSRRMHLMPGSVPLSEAT